MKTYSVKGVVSLYFDIDIEAEDEGEAREKVCEMTDEELAQRSCNEGSVNITEVIPNVP